MSPNVDAERAGEAADSQDETHVPAGKTWTRKKPKGEGKRRKGEIGIRWTRSDAERR